MIGDVREIDNFVIAIENLLKPSNKHESMKGRNIDHPSIKDYSLDNAYTRRVCITDSDNFLTEFIIFSVQNALTSSDFVFQRTAADEVRPGSMPKMINSCNPSTLLIWFDTCAT